MRAPQTRPLLPLLVVLLALAGVGLMLKFALESTPLGVVDLSVSRAQAGQIAADFLRAQGDDPSARWSTTNFSFDSNAQSFIVREAGRPTLEQRAAADLDFAHWRVRFWNPLNPDQWEIDISSRTGRITGFRHRLPDEQAGATLSITAAQTLAEQALPVPLSALELQSRASVTQPERMDYVFVWRRPALAIGAAEYRYAVRVQGDQIGGQDEYYWLPESWWQEAAWQGRRGALLATVGWSLAYALTVLIGLTWLIEARRGRMRRRWALTLWLLVLGVGVLVMFNSLPLDLANYDVNQSLASYLVSTFGGYLSQLVTLTTTIVLAGMVGEALVWERSGGALHMSAMVTRRGIVSRPTVQALLVGGLVGVAQLGFVSAFYALGSRWFGVWSPVQALYDDTLSTPFPPLYGLALGLLPAVGEELLFRLGGISVLTRWTGKPRLAVVITAIMWASLHATYPQRPFFIRMLELTLVGVVFGSLFLRYGVLASMAAHFTYNASLYVPLFWGGPLWLLIAGVLAAALVAWLLIPALVRTVRGVALEPDATVAEALPPVVAPEAHSEAPAAAPINWRLVVVLNMVGLLVLAWVGWPSAAVMQRTGTASAAIAATRPIAAAQQIDLTGLHAEAFSVASWADIDLDYLNEHATPDAARALIRSGTPQAWVVRWSAWDRPDWWQVTLGPANQLVAWSHSIPEDQAGATLPVTVAQQLATTALAQHVNLNDYELLDVTTSVRTARTDYTFTWQSRQPVVAAAYRRISVGVQGDRVDQYSPFLYTPPEYRRAREQTTTLEALLKSGPGLLIGGLELVFGLLGLIGVARRRVALWPWVRLGLLVGGLSLLQASLRLTQGQLQELPRALAQLSNALTNAVLLGGEITLLAAGVATLWRWWLADRPSLAQQLGVLWFGGVRRSSALLLALLLLPWALVLLKLYQWPWVLGAWSSTAPLRSWLPVVDVLSSAVISAVRTALLLAGAWACGWRWLRRPLPTALVVAAGLLLGLVDLVQLPSLWLLLGVWLASAGVAWLCQRSIVAVLALVLLAQLLPASLKLTEIGPTWYQFNGWLGLLVVVAVIVLAGRWLGHSADNDFSTSA